MWRTDDEQTDRVQVMSKKFISRPIPQTLAVQWYIIRNGKKNEKKWSLLCSTSPKWWMLRTIRTVYKHVWHWPTMSWLLSVKFYRTLGTSRGFTVTAKHPGSCMHIHHGLACPYSVPCTATYGVGLRRGWRHSPRHSSNQIKVSVLTIRERACVRLTRTVLFISEA